LLETSLHTQCRRSIRFHTYFQTIVQGIKCPLQIGDTPECKLTHSPGTIIASLAMASRMGRRFLPGLAALAVPAVGSGELDLFARRRSSHVICEEAAPSSPWAVKTRPNYWGELTPPRLQNASIFPTKGSVHLHSGSYGSRWVRVLPQATKEDIQSSVDSALDGASSAVYVGIPDDLPECGAVVADLRKKGFKFHHFNPDTGKDKDAVPGELIYYRWCGKGHDVVPSYATALEGVGCIILNPKKDCILLVWEYGHWKLITGNVDLGESMRDTCKREVHEEVGLDIEDELVMIGGWQQAKSRDDSINNTFCVFAAVAKDTKTKVDGVEIEAARWFPLASFPTNADEAKAPQDPKLPWAMDWDVGIPGKNLVSRSVVHFLDAYRNGRGLKIKSRFGRDFFE